MRVLIAGAGGMLGHILAEYCRGLGDEVIAYDRHALDITEAAAVEASFTRERPETVINCAAWTDVDGCELDAARAFRVNAYGPEILAGCSRLVGASFVTISTDFVFDGTKEGFYTQRDDPNPASVYGKAKLEGERRAQSASARTIVVRTGWIYGIGGRNFLSQLVKLAERGERLKAIHDAYGTPTYAKDLAARLRHLAELDLPGIYHITNSGEGTSYQGFAEAALRAAGQQQQSLIEPVSMDDLKRPAPRPRNSRLRCLISEALGLAPLPFWQDALQEFVAESLCPEPPL